MLNVNAIQVHMKNIIKIAIIIKMDHLRLLIRFSNISISPNPYIVGSHDEIIFSNISANTKVMIMTLNGVVIKTFNVLYNNEKINWNGKTDQMKDIPSGIYLVGAYNSDKNTGVNKIVIINK